MEEGSERKEAEEERGKLLNHGLWAHNHHCKHKLTAAAAIHTGPAQEWPLPSAVTGTLTAELRLLTDPWKGVVTVSGC